ncbi:MAG: glycerol-3-phosphate dehydrogenase/oxidase [Comamonadaceae bacterium]|nr:glycerol-3-phosphate dehydrogenase/oxidase [Comamonadaceae bacterium]
MTEAPLLRVIQLAASQPLANRKGHRDRMVDSQVDVLVIGGGITGAGVALDAVSRGLKVALVERADFASGTSSRSSKMIHGGFRYLQTGDVALVRESLHERHRLQNNAPHLVSLLPFMIPLFLKGGLINPKLSRALGAALWSYQFAGAWKLLKRHRRLNQDQVRAHMPSLDIDRIGGAYLFHDLRADDARLTFAVLATAAERGANVLNHASCEQISDYQQGARTVTIRTDDDVFSLRARMVVNATGIWADRLLESSGLRSSQRLSPAKGTHLVVRSDLLRNDVAVSIPVASDKRTVSVVDAGPFSYIGSTDTTGAFDINTPSVTMADVDYILHGLNRHLRVTVQPEDITSGWAGFRPLLADASKGRSADLSRRHHISVDGDGFISVTGGKLTTYRQMAEGAMDTAVSLLGTNRRSTTRDLKLHGWHQGASHLDSQDRLGKRYGNRASILRSLQEVAPSLGQRVTPTSDTLVAEAVWALHAEMAVDLSDALLRRTRVGTYDGRALLANADAIGASILAWTDWSESQRQRAIDKLKTTLRSELGVLADQPLPPSDLPVTKDTHV